MHSVLAWIDHDSQARACTLSIIPLFQEEEIRDELGLGSVRDSFVDQLFLGTSQHISCAAGRRFYLASAKLARQLLLRLVPARADHVGVSTDLNFPGFLAVRNIRCGSLIGPGHEMSSLTLWNPQISD